MINRKLKFNEIDNVKIDGTFKIPVGVNIY